MALGAILGSAYTFFKKRSSAVAASEAGHVQFETLDYKLLTPFNWAMLALVAFGVISILARFVLGLGGSTNLSDTYPWGLWIVFDLVWIAVAAGAYLIAIAGWQLLVVGAASILAGVLYTGGPRPYGYEGLGELFVFLFFGVVAVVGSYYVQTENLHWTAFALSVPVGLLVSAILVVNNIRDIETDRRAGKRTLAVRIGRDRARSLFTSMVVLSYVVPVGVWLAGGLSAWLLLVFASLPLVPPLVRTVYTRSDGPSLNRALADTGRLVAVFSLLLAAGELLS